MFLRHVGPGHQLIETAVGVAVDEPGERVGEEGLRLDVVHLADLHERGEDRPMFAAAL